MRTALHTYRVLFGDKAFLLSLGLGVCIFVASAVAVFHAVSYATVHARLAIRSPDLVLSNVRPINVRFLFVYGTFTEFVVLSTLLIARPNRLPFALKGIGAFLLVRALFITLTHVAPFPIDPQKPAPIFNSIFFGGDLFFSGHTGLPFFGALAFWHIRKLRYFYLASTAFFGAVVLLGHYHYSIDVLAALFISYGIFQLSVWLFPRDYKLFRSPEAFNLRESPALIADPIAAPHSPPTNAGCAAELAEKGLAPTYLRAPSTTRR